ncbi:hypothetical protein MKQ70_28400 [Chitinophaga sedimenti]|uniref:hypothetical protein n=1 Tax=Chitinophaga sedimenti TaxID=2033606 RepID=UPI002005C0CC|nr:hypothetical protein [Chitinophaga sedimenti]MCK7558699.1 hypothetical protein [Chitinophaga sedimenti]
MQNEKDLKFHEGRRDFMKQGSLLAGGMLAAPLLSQANYFSGSAGVIKIALIGCGGRGSGAAVQALRTKQNVQLVAMADAFRDRLDGAYTNIKEDLGEAASRVAVPESNKFVGFDGYKKRSLWPMW